MKAVVLAFIILIWNISLAGVSGSGLFANAGINYENNYYETYTGNIPDYLNSSDTNQQTTVSTNILGAALSTLSWNWIYSYVPAEMSPYITWLVIGLNVMSLFIAGMAIVELFKIGGGELI